MKFCLIASFSDHCLLLLFQMLIYLLNKHSHWTVSVQYVPSQFLTFARERNFINFDMKIKRLKSVEKDCLFNAKLSSMRVLGTIDFQSFIFVKCHDTSQYLETNNFTSVW